MSRFKLLLEYEGTRYSGWQIQANARTVQGEIQKAIHTVFKTSAFDFSGSGRTDAGVHALAQVAHLDVQTVLAPEIIRLKLNDELPADINILDVWKAPTNFHARHSAVGRSYLYQISRRRTAFGKRYVWWIKDRLDLRAMEQAAHRFIGMKNFQSFTADDPEEKSTKVLVEKLALQESGDLILIRIEGSHFLWKMVRQIVGVLAEAGRGNISAEQIDRFFRGGSTFPAQHTAPPSGLFLERVYYPGDARPTELHPVMDIGSPGNGRTNRS